MQLELFPQEPKGEVFVFPVARRADIVRQTAEALMSRSNAAGARYWRKHVAELSKHLQSLKCSAQVIDEQMMDYARAVSHQLSILRYKQTG